MLRYPIIKNSVFDISFISSENIFQLMVPGGLQKFIPNHFFVTWWILEKFLH